MGLNIQIGRSKELGTWLHSQTNEIGFENVTERERMSFSLFQQALDADDGIIILLESNLPGPALALARPRFEAYVRGLWLLIGASDESIEKFKQGKCPNFATLMDEIGNDAKTGGAWIKANADANLKDFHDLTHGGMAHILRRNTATSIEPNYPEEELKALLEFGLEIKIRVGVEILARAKLEEALEQLHDKARVIRDAL